jgi:hypothetical protein
MPTIAELPLKTNLIGNEEIPLNDAGFDRKTTISAIQQPAIDHQFNTSNPHNTTKSQIGLSLVDNTPDSLKPVSGPQAAALAARGNIATSGLQLGGQGLAGRADSGPGALALIELGSGLSLTGNVLSATAPVSVAGTRLSEVDTATVPSDYLIILGGSVARTVTLSESAPAGQIVVVRNEATSPLVMMTVTGAVGGQTLISYRNAATFMRAASGWLPISDRLQRQTLELTDAGGPLYELTSALYDTVLVTVTGEVSFDLVIPAPDVCTHLPLTISVRADSTEPVTVGGHINGATTELAVFPGETMHLVSTGSTWRSTRPWAATQQRTLAANVVNANASANTLELIEGLQMRVCAGGRYHFRFAIPYTAQATGTGSRWTIDGPSFTALSYTSNYPLTGSTQTTNYGLTGYYVPPTSNATSLLNGSIAIIEGLIQPSATGLLRPFFASEVPNSAITALAGAMVSLTRLP